MLEAFDLLEASSPPMGQTVFNEVCLQDLFTEVKLSHEVMSAEPDFSIYFQTKIILKKFQVKEDNECTEITEGRSLRKLIKNKE